MAGQVAGCVAPLDIWGHEEPDENLRSFDIKVAFPVTAVTVAPNRASQRCLARSGRRAWGFHTATRAPEDEPGPMPQTSKRKPQGSRTGLEISASPRPPGAVVTEEGDRDIRGGTRRPLGLRKGGAPAWGMSAWRQPHWHPPPGPGPCQRGRAPHRSANSVEPPR
jgi:hypothetical protein